MDIDNVLNTFEKDFASHLESLKRLAKIPSISFPDFDHKFLDTSAEAVAALLRESGLQDVKILNYEKAFPYVLGTYGNDPKKPTLLLYAHHDVQPPGREEYWKTEPFTPTEREGPGGNRLYGRGTADDKAGIVVHTAAIASYLKTISDLPVNVRVLIEGEEEIGSEHLTGFLHKYQSELNADIIVLTDTANYDCGTPSLTVALRGMAGVEIEVSALSKTIHSGLWSGPIPDPTQGLAKILATLVDDNGRIAIPEIRAMTPKLSAEQIVELEKLPFDEKSFREQSGMLPKVNLFKDGPHPFARIWYEPSLTVNAVQASSKKQAGNIIVDTAWARLTIRVAPGMNAQQVSDALVSHIKKSVPWNLDVKVTAEPPASPWAATPHSQKHAPVFQAGLSALAKGYGKNAVLMGCGATIPFVEPFAKALAGAPALLIGVEDPYTNAHGENESLLISDFKSACRAQIYLFSELAKLK